MTATVYLPLPPSTNALWRQGRKRVFKSARYASWLKAAGTELQLQRQKPVHGPYSLHYVARRKNERRRDLDNLTKPLSDLLVRHRLVDDDSLCREISCEWWDELEHVGGLGGPLLSRGEVMLIVSSAKETP
jgi:Holliday junction resolvase RusA-like endonuclease